MKKLIKDNQGYSLVEMVICIAIIAILSGMAVISLSSIANAKASTAREDFDQEIAALQMRIKSQDKDNAIRIERDGKKYNVYYGTCASGSFVANDPSKPDIVLDRVEIHRTYPGEADDELLDEMVFRFNKSDNYSISGYGRYDFYKPGASSPIGSVTINKNTGSHYFGS